MDTPSDDKLMIEYGLVEETIDCLDAWWSAKVYGDPLAITAAKEQYRGALLRLVRYTQTGKP